MTTTTDTRKNSQNLTDWAIELPAASNGVAHFVSVYALDLTEVSLASEVRLWAHTKNECIPVEMTPAQARKLAQALLLSADEAEEADKR
jgi:hypothetical protein